MEAARRNARGSVEGRSGHLGHYAFDINVILMRSMPWTINNDIQCTTASAQSTVTRRSLIISCPSSSSQHRCSQAFDSGKILYLIIAYFYSLLCSGTRLRVFILIAYHYYLFGCLVYFPFIIADQNLSIVNYLLCTRLN